MNRKRPPPDVELQQLLEEDDDILDDSDEEMDTDDEEDIENNYKKIFLQQFCKIVNWTNLLDLLDNLDVESAICTTEKTHMLSKLCFWLYVSCWETFICPASNHTGRESQSTVIRYLVKQ